MSQRHQCDDLKTCTVSTAGDKPSLIVLRRNRAVWSNYLGQGESVRTVPENPGWSGDPLWDSAIVEAVKESCRLSQSVQRQYTSTPATVWLNRTQLVMMFCLALTLLAVIAVYAREESHRASQARTWVTHTLVVMQRAMELENAVMLMEVDHRAFLVRNDSVFLASRDGHREEAAQILADLRSLTRDNAGQQSRLDTIASLLARRVERMRETTEIVKRESIDAARAQFDPMGKNSIEPLRGAIAELDQAEARLLESRSLDAAEKSRRLDWLLLLGPGLGIVLLGIGLYALLGQLRRSERTGEELVRANDEARHALGLLDATHDGVFIYDADTFHLSYVNQGAVNQVGYARDELLGMTAFDIKPGIDESGFRHLHAPLLAGKVDSLAYETVHRRKDGSDVPVEAVSRYAKSGNDVSSVVTIARDISARKQAEDERDRFFNLSLDMLCIASADGYFKRVSPAFTKTLGWSIEELLARPFLDFVHPDDHAATQAEVERQVRAGEAALQFENRYRHKDGSWRVLSWKSVPQAGGMMYATARDVTESKATELHIVNLNRELTDRQAALEDANKELEAFTSSVSHDLRAPLRHIDGYARILQEDAVGQLDDGMRRYLDAISTSARKMGTLIDELLAFSRLGRKPIERTMVDMNVLAEQALHEVGGERLGSSRVRVAMLPPAYGDPALLRQVWVNLLSNALKYSAKRGDAAGVEVSGERDGDVVRYRVRDNGVGFDMRYVDKLFGVFHRLHSQEEFEGTGVGLAIVQRIVSRHGGNVRAEGELGRGATFLFEVPVVEAQTTEDSA
ncbi:MAG TPA: PAS domain S-box protein [Xanthomonadaceae bacterium]|nr:PAS domain S-box protein [Xanthomonadaceae bacterium]